VASGVNRQSGPRAIYLARRHPFLDHEQFIGRWRAHGVLSQQLEGWGGVSRYEQNPALLLPSSLISSLPGGTQSYDGIGMSWFRDDEAIRGFASDSQQMLLRFDELQTFDALVANNCFVGRRSVECGDRRCGVKLVTFLRRLVDDSPIRELAAAILETPGFSNHVVKYTETSPCAFDYPGGGRPGLAGYGPVIEIGFVDMEGLTDALSAPPFTTEVLPAWQSANDGAAITVAVTELLLYDEAQP
jgi:EthD domain